MEEGMEEGDLHHAGPSSISLEPASEPRWRRKYVCKVCQETFGLLSDIKKHLVTHTGEICHVCEVCGKGFSRKFCLTRHLRRTHAKKKE